MILRSTLGLHFAPRSTLTLTRGARAFSTNGTRRVLNVSSTYESKYAEKLKAKMDEKGVKSLEELRAKTPPLVRETVGTPRKPDVPSSSSSSSASSSELKGKGDAAKPAAAAANWMPSERKDSSPIKPLSSFLNIPLITSRPHTADQISALWTLYHSTRSGGTGRGYLSASMSREQYESMLVRAKKWPIFVVPLPVSVEGAVEEAVEGKGEEGATEFYFAQWDMYERPEDPSSIPSSPLDALLSTGTTTASSTPPPSSQTQQPLPQSATLILTPLEEYKLRAQYATPRLVLTYYPHFANTHDLVLLRGEISQSSESSSYLLSQIQAQLLALTTQRFYMGDAKGGKDEKEELLRVFHEEPGKFDWKELIRVGRLA